MSRHRDVRCMNYSEEYEGYDDVYGHSVEDDYCVSPSAEQFLFDRSKQQNIASFITEPDIVEGNEDSDEAITPSNKEDVALTKVERAKLLSCMESIKNIIGDTIPDSEIKKKIIQSNFDAEAALDLVLKDCSSKNIIDATSDKSETSTFIMPKLSFDKQDNIDTLNVSLKHNLESLKNLTTSTSSTISPSSELIANHAISLSNTMKESKVNSNTMSFNSLEDLIANHLKANNLSNNTNFYEKPFSLSTNFVIPKLSIRENKNNDLNDTQLNSPSVQNNRNVELDSVDDKMKDYSVDSLERSISNVLAISEDYSNIKDNSLNLERKEDSLLNISTRTPSPDNCMIDLSSALKEVVSLASDNCSQLKPNMSISRNNNILNLNLHDSNQSIENPYIILPTTLNLSFLNNVELPYTKKYMSLFGRTLCRTWKLKKLLLKSQEQQHQNIKRFDFSIPYSRNNSS